MLHAIRAILLADTDVSALVSTRITTGVRPQAQALPAIVLEEQSTETNETKNATSGLDEVRFTVTSFSETYAQALDIGDKCRAALDLFIGQIGTPAVNFDEIRYRSSSEDYYDTNDSGIYHRTLSLTAYVKLSSGGPNYPAGVNEPVTIKNTDDSYNQSAAAGSTHIIADITVSNSDDSYTVAKVAAVDVEIPDTTIKRTMGDLSVETWFTAESAADHIVSHSRIEDEDGTQVTNYGVGQRIKVMAAFTSSDVSEDGTRVTITPPTGVTPSGRLYFPPPISQRTSYENYDEGWHQQAGTFNYSAPANPERLMLLDTANTTAPGMHLATTNEFSNTDRFTDTAGGQTYTNPLIIDHHTGLMWLDDLQSRTSWATQLSNANSHSEYTYTDWRVPTQAELMSLVNQESTGWFTPFTAVSTNTIWTGTIYRETTTQAQTLWSISNFAKANQTNIYAAMYVRNHYT